MEYGSSSAQVATWQPEFGKLSDNQTNNNKNQPKTTMSYPPPPNGYPNNQYAYPPQPGTKKRATSLCG